MKKRDNGSMSDELRHALQQGDPAGEGGLAPAERDRLRRQVVAAAEAPGRPWFPVVRTLGYAAAGLAAVMGGWLALQSLTQRTGTQPVLPPAIRTPVVAQNAPGEEPLGKMVQEPLLDPVRVAAQPLEEPAENVVPAEAVASAVLPPSGPREPRQLQFIVGTTRVIWTLDPDFDLGPSRTAEQGETS